jgi:CHAT domain-containing protein
MDELTNWDISGHHQLLEEAQLDLEGRPGLAGPAIPLPRAMLAFVLARDVGVDAMNSDEILPRLAEVDEDSAELYGIFLTDVKDSAHIRAASSALKALWTIEPDNLRDFLLKHPELASEEAVALVHEEFGSLPLSLRADVPPNARVALVDALAAGQEIDAVVDQYTKSFNQFWLDSGLPAWNELNERLANDPSPGLIPESRQLLQAARSAGIGERVSALDLARRLLQLPRPRPQTATKEAIELLEQVRNLSSSRDPVWVQATANLGIAVAERRDVDPTLAWEQSCRFLRDACRFSVKSEDPAEWAMTRSNLGYALIRRPEGSTVDDLSEALKVLDEAQGVQTGIGDVIALAHTHLGRAVAFRERGQPGDCEKAVVVHRLALKGRPPGDQNPVWAAHYFNLTLALETLDPSDVKDIISLIDEGLLIEMDPYFKGLLLASKAQLLEREHGILSESVISLRTDAAEALDPRWYPEDQLRIGDALAESLQRLGRWREAAAQFERSLVAFETLYNRCRSPAERQQLLAVDGRLGRWAAYAFARCDLLDRAVETIERSRAMELSIARRREEADLSKLATVRPAVVRRYYEALEESQHAALQFDVRQNVGVTDLEVVNRAEDNLCDVIEDIRTVPGFESFLRPLTLQHIAAAAGNSTVIYILTSAGGTYCITLRTVGMDIDLHATHIDAVTGRVLADLVVANFEVGRLGLLGAQLAEAPLDNPIRRLDALFPVVCTIAAELDRTQARDAVIVPTGLWGLVPLSALPIRQDSRLLFDDVCQVQLAPSVTLFRSSHNRASLARDLRFVGVADTDSSRPLDGSRAELEAIAAKFSRVGNMEFVEGEEATLSWLKERAQSASHLHLACHGFSRFGHPLAGALILGKGTSLSPLELNDFQLSARLVVMSACQSGHLAVGESLDEFTGLTGSFLEAGAACVVASLWPVFDDSTALLMTRFYEYLLETELPPPEALRRARKWLRGLTLESRERYLADRPELASALRHYDIPPPFRGRPSPHALPYSSPVHWAAFVAYGC